jgi:hypothetical protein
MRLPPSEGRAAAAKQKGWKPGTSCCPECFRPDWHQARRALAPRPLAHTPKPLTPRPRRPLARSSATTRRPPARRSRVCRQPPRRSAPRRTSPGLAAAAAAGGTTGRWRLRSCRCTTRAAATGPGAAPALVALVAAAAWLGASTTRAAWAATGGWDATATAVYLLAPPGGGPPARLRPTPPHNSPPAGLCTPPTCSTRTSSSCWRRTGLPPRAAPAPFRTCTSSPWPPPLRCRPGPGPGRRGWAQLAPSPPCWLLELDGAPAAAAPTPLGPQPQPCMDTLGRQQMPSERRAPSGAAGRDAGRDGVCGLTGSACCLARAAGERVRPCARAGAGQGRRRQPGGRRGWGGRARPRAAAEAPEQPVV